MPTIHLTQIQTLTRHYPVTRTHRLPTEPMRSTHLLDYKVEIELSERLGCARSQERTGEDLNIGADCLPPSEPFESPFSWFTGIVTVDGERLTNVGIRKKGFIGSMNENKPSLKIRFDKFEEDQTYLDAKRLTLNNDVQDPSYVRQCLAYDLFRAVGTPAPRCNYAHVFVNGVDMGVYTNVESIKKPFVRRNFSDPEGNLYEGTLSDFREGWMGTFNQKTNGDTPDKTAINGLAEVLQGPDDTLIEGISNYVDLDAFLNFWVIETLTAHWDGYAGNTNNYHMYHDPTSDRLHFIPWGVDQTFQSTFMLFEGRLAPHSINTAGLLTRRLYLHPEGQAMYLERLTEVMDAYWDPEALVHLSLQCVQSLRGSLSNWDRSGQVSRKPSPRPSPLSTVATEHCVRSLQMDQSNGPITT